MKWRLISEFVAALLKPFLLHIVKTTQSVQLASASWPVNNDVMVSFYHMLIFWHFFLLKPPHPCTVLFFKVVQVFSSHATFAWNFFIQRTSLCKKKNFMQMPNHLYDKGWVCSQRPAEKSIQLENAWDISYSGMLSMQTVIPHWLCEGTVFGRDWWYCYISMLIFIMYTQFLTVIWRCISNAYTTV